MLGMLLYCIGIMYTPGPVNILSLNTGIQAGRLAHIRFSLGVATGLCFWFMVAGYAGRAVLGNGARPGIAALGVGFILYLAWKIMSSDVDIEGQEQGGMDLGFMEGVFMQLLNPKSFMVVLPVASVHFPALGVHGFGVALWSVGLACLGFGAPFLYGLLGLLLARRITSASLLRWFNRIMGLMLLAVALDMAWTQVLPALR